MCARTCIAADLGNGNSSRLLPVSIFHTLDVLPEVMQQSMCRVAISPTTASAHWLGKDLPADRPAHMPYRIQWREPHLLFFRACCAPSVASQRRSTICCYVAKVWGFSTLGLVEQNLISALANEAGSALGA